MGTVSTARFVSRELPQSEGLPAFQRLTASLYETRVLGELDAFEADATAYRVGDLIFNEATFSPLRFRRSQKHLPPVYSDFFVLQEQLEGEELVVMDHGIVRLLPGKIYLRDWSLPFDSRATAMRLRSVLIPRQRLIASVGPGEGSPVLSWSIETADGRLLQRLWSELVALLPEAESDAAETACRGFLGFLDGLLRRNGPLESNATLREMEQFLLLRLQADVGVNNLSRRFNVSRSTVYRLFEPHGGVHQFLNRQRMERCFHDLRFADARHSRVGDIAASWRFFDASSFSRRFRSQFGVSPSEILGSASSKGESDGSGTSDPGTGPFRQYRNWLNQTTRKAGDRDRAVLGP